MPTSATPLSEHPEADSPETLAKQAQCATDQGRPAEAVMLYRRLLEHDPRSGPIRNNLGALLLELGEADDAVDVLDQPDLVAAPPELAGNLGFALLRAGELHRAEQVFRSILEGDPGDTEARNHLGMALLRRRRPAAAVREFERVARVSPYDVECRINLGCAREALDDWTGASRAFQEALRVDPYNVSANNNLGCALREMGRSEEALEALTIAIDLEPDNPTIHLNLALTYRRSGNLKKALSHLRRRLRLTGAESRDEATELHSMLRELEAVTTANTTLTPEGPSHP